MHDAITTPIMLSGTAREVAFAAGRHLGEIRGFLLSGSFPNESRRRADEPGGGVVRRIRTSGLSVQSTERLQQGFVTVNCQRFATDRDIDTNLAVGACLRVDSCRDWLIGIGDLEWI